MAVIEQLEAGVRPWAKPWDAAHPAGPVSRPLRANGEPYRGINVLMLWLEAAARGYGAPIWMTYRQAQQQGGQVRRGACGSMVTFADRLHRAEPDEARGEEVGRSIFFLRSYTVFNVEQIDGLPERFHPVAAPRITAAQRIGRAERFFAALGADIQHGGDQACYLPGPDRVRMPLFESFQDAESYYTTLGHECVHWTGHASRLDRRHQGDGGRAGYAREELVAEMGAAFLAADLGLDLTPREDHAAYLAQWLAVLRADKRAIVAAASQAQKALDHLRDLQADA